MRHGKKVNHLGRTTSHRKAMLSNMACSLIEFKRINTTVAKAKALRGYIEPLITKSKNDTTHSRRTVFSYLKSKYSVTELFGVVSPKVADRPGGYTRIIRTGYRLGDNAEMCMIELVDFNELLLGADTKKTTRRSRRGAGSAKTEGSAKPEATSSDEAETETPMAAAPVAEASADVKADDLKIIEGIGPVLEKHFNANGIFTFEQMANSTAEALNAILDLEAKFKVHDAGTWTEQARLANEGKMDELKELQDRLKGGKEEA
jgi:large subunit ribosomal protein L17